MRPNILLSYCPKSCFFDAESWSWILASEQFLFPCFCCKFLWMLLKLLLTISVHEYPMTETWKTRYHTNHPKLYTPRRLPDCRYSLCYASRWKVADSLHDLKPALKKVRAPVQRGNGGNTFQFLTYNLCQKNTFPQGLDGRNMLHWPGWRILHTNKSRVERSG